MDEVAGELGLDVLGKLPINPEFAKKADCGVCFDIDLPEMAPAVKKLESLLTDYDK